MSDNTEYFPNQEFHEQPNAIIDSVIKGYGNIVAHSTRNTIVNGDSNYVGEETKNITILNSSGCVVSSGVVGCVIIASSGVVVTDSGQMWISNNRVDLNPIPNIEPRYITDNYTATLLDDLIVVDAIGVNIHLLSYTDLGNVSKRYYIKNASTGDITLTTSSLGFDPITRATTITLASEEAVTVQAWYQFYLIL